MKPAPPSSLLHVIQWRLLLRFESRILPSEILSSHLDQILCYSSTYQSYSDVHPGNLPIRKVVGWNVQGDQEISFQPLHELARQSKHPLLPFVRPHFILRSLSSCRPHIPV
jgi:hypothetical protein